MRKRSVEKKPVIIFFIGLFFLLIVLLQILFIDPEIVGGIFIPNAYLTFFIPLFLAFFFIIGAVLQNRRRTLLISLSLVIFLYLRLFGFGTALNFILLAGIVASIEYYFTSHYKKTVV